MTVRRLRLVTPPVAVHELLPLLGVAEWRRDRTPGGRAIQQRHGLVQEVRGLTDPLVADGAQRRKLGGDVLHRAVVGGRDDDLVTGQFRAQLSDTAGSPFVLPCDLPAEGLPRRVQSGQGRGPFHHDRGDQVAEHRGLARAGRTVHREEPGTGAEFLHDTVDRELLAQRERMFARCRPASERDLGGGDLLQHGVRRGAHVHADAARDRLTVGQVGGQPTAVSACGVGAGGIDDPLQVLRQQTVEERGLRIGKGSVLAAAHPLAVDADAVRGEQIEDPAQVGDVGGEGHEVGELHRPTRALGLLGGIVRCHPVGEVIVGGRCLDHRCDGCDGCDGLRGKYGGGVSSEACDHAAPHRAQRARDDPCPEVPDEDAQSPDGGTAQDLADDRLPATAGGERRSETPLATGRGNTDGPRGGRQYGRRRLVAVRDVLARQECDGLAAGKLHILEAVEPIGVVRPRVADPSGRPRAAGERRGAVEEYPLIVHGEGEDRSLAPLPCTRVVLLASPEGALKGFPDGR